MDAQGDLFKFYDGVAGHASVRNGQLTGSLLSAVYGPVTVARRVTGTQARPEPPMASHGQAAAHAGQEFVSESAAGASVVGPRPGRRGHGGHRDVGGHHFSATVTSLARRRRQLGYAALRALPRCFCVRCPGPAGLSYPAAAAVAASERRAAGP